MADYYGDYGYGNGGYSNYPGYGGPPRGGGGPPPQGYNGYPPPVGGGFGGMPVPGFDASNDQYQQSPLDAEVAAVLHEIRSEVTGFDANPEFGEQYRNAKRLLNSGMRFTYLIIFK